MPDRPVTVYSDAQGYRYDETSLSWKETCSVLPCFAALAWPDYATAVIKDTINGRPIVIQLWKGLCQRFLGSDDFPGGVGAEVGLYEQVPGRRRPESAPFLPSTTWTWLQSKAESAHDDQLWWPVTDLGVQVEFELINPVTNKTFFTAGPQTTYWLTKWMVPDSYRKYQLDQGKRWAFLPRWFPGNSRTPSFHVDYRLKYKINGKTYPTW